MIAKHSSGALPSVGITGSETSTPTERFQPRQARLSLPNTTPYPLYLPASRDSSIPSLYLP